MFKYSRKHKPPAKSLAIRQVQPNDLVSGSGGQRSPPYQARDVHLQYDLLESNYNPTSHNDVAVNNVSNRENTYGIKILHDPPSATLDIVFVHGLTGNAYSTWLHEQSSVHWPRDLVKEDIGDARVMTFGYDADVARLWEQAAQDGVSGYAHDLLGRLARKRRGAENRKIVFVAHSLGGLVTQRALTLSRESRSEFRHLQDIENSTVGICFLGTPHHGADLAKWGVVLSNIANIVRPANRAPVQLLQRGSEMLRDVQDDFHNLLEKRKQEKRKIKITCFYETLPLVRFLVVPKESAVISGELAYALRANHVDMTKFSSRDADGYEDVVDEIQRLSEDTPLSDEEQLLDQSNPSPLADPVGRPSPMNNYGSGTINVNNGSGTSNYNTGSGQQYIGQTQNFTR